MLKGKALEKASQLSSAISRKHDKIIAIDDTEKVKDCISVFFDVLHVNGFRYPYYPKDRALSKEEKRYNTLYSDSRDLTTLMWSAYVDRKGTDSWKDLFKYKINSFFSYAFEQELPPQPDGLEEFVKLQIPSKMVFGIASRWLFRCKTRDPVLFKDIALSFLQSKKGAPPVSSETVMKSRYATWVQLVTEPGALPEFVVRKDTTDEWRRCSITPSILRLDELPSMDSFCSFNRGIDWSEEYVREFSAVNIVNKEWVCEQLRRTTKEIFGKVSLDSDSMYKPFFPSTSANYNYSRDDSGAVSAVYHAYKKFGTYTPCINLYLGNVTLLGRTTEEYGERGEAEAKVILEAEIENGPEVKETLGLLYDESILAEQWKEAYDSLFNLALEEKPLTKTIGLPEPLKVRVITCGPPITYSVLKPFQKFLWKTLKNLPVFKLIGQPIEAEFLMSQVGSLREGEEYVSGDYKASTDYLHSWVSEEINKEIFECFRWNGSPINSDFLNKLEILSNRALTGHLIEDPTNPKNIKSQREGQLMGSIVSFPYLCIANAALCRVSMELANLDKYSLRDVPLAINGDDCVFKGIKGRIRPFWEAITKMGGLMSSVGKTYFSDKFLVMNSVHFDYDNGGWTDDQPEKFLKERKYVNMGLVYGQSKCGDRDKCISDLGVLHRELRRTCPDEKFSNASSIFIRHHRSKMNSYSVPWFLPEWLGGMGLEHIGPVSKKEKVNLAVAKSIMVSLNDPLSPRTSAPEMFRGIEEWIMHRIVMKKFRSEWAWIGSANYRQISYDDTIREISDEWQNYYTNCVVDLLFYHNANSGYPDGTPRSDQIWCPTGQIDGFHRTDPSVGINHGKALKLTRSHNEKMYQLHLENVNNPSTKGYFYQTAPKTFGALKFEKKLGNYPLFSTRV